MLEIYNSMSRKIETFTEREEGKVRIFTCGPSIYQKAHLGNYRTFLYEDLLVRYLMFSGYDVERAMNLTDIEDKAISEAQKNETDVESLTGDVLKIFRSSLDGFGFIMPEHLVPASESIEMSVKIIKKLVESGHAYEHEGDYFFDPLKAEGFGRLFGLDMSSWPKKRQRFKRDTYNGNRWNRGDFILWHGHRGEEGHPSWNTALGEGRPSWNIQDPAIIAMSIGDQVDINCGGIDNIYRHHDYNIAVMEAYTGLDYSNYYMHGEHLIVEGRSMSKSRGNIIYPEQLIDKGYSWKEIRFFLTYKHYRKKLNYTAEKFEEAVRRLRGFRADLKAVRYAAGEAGSPGAQKLIDAIVPDFRAALDGDLSLGRGFDSTAATVRRIKKCSDRQPLSSREHESLTKSLKKIDNVLNVIYAHNSST